MYRRVLLAYDGSVEGRRALSEGAQLAKLCGAEVFLLAVVNPSTHIATEFASEVLLENDRRHYEEILAEGARRLTSLGFSPTTRLKIGNPAREIGTVASEIAADLVVVGHRRQGALERWWRGSTGSYLIDHVDCSVLVARKEFGDDEFFATDPAKRNRGG